MRTSASLRIGEPATAAVCWLPTPSLADRWNCSSPDQDPADPLVLGRLSDDHRQTWCVRLACAASARIILLRNCLDDASQTTPGHGECADALKGSLYFCIPTSATRIPAA